MTYSPTDVTNNTRDYLHFLNDCPSPFHAASVVAQRLVDAGFTEHSETDPWDASPGGHVIIRDGAVMAWLVPQTVSNDTAFRIVGAHTDSPTFTLKPHASTQTPDGWNQLGVEVYGGMLMNSWLDRELALAGRLVLADGSQRLIRTKALARIPQLAVHLDRGVNSEGLKLDPQQHLRPVWSVNSTDADVLDIIAEEAGLASTDEITAYELVTIPTQAAALFGADAQFVASGRQDNLSSVHAGLVALEKYVADGIPQTGDVCVFACFDHEEIGSQSRTGAAGPILSDVLTRTAHALGCDADGVARMIAGSTCVSADASHSVHPNYADRHDPDTRPIMGGGPITKLNANQRYATNANGIALWRRALAAAGVEGQEFVSHNSMPCGSTIGPITATRLGITTIDVGIPLLSMHSAREMSHIDDQYALTETLGAYWAGA